MTRKYKWRRMKRHAERSYFMIYSRPTSPFSKVACSNDEFFSWGTPHFWSKSFSLGQRFSSHFLFGSGSFSSSAQIIFLVSPGSFLLPGTALRYFRGRGSPWEAVFHGAAAAAALPRDVWSGMMFGLLNQRDGIAGPISPRPKLLWITCDRVT